MLTFRKYDDHAEVYKCNNLAIKVEIPSEIDGLPVTIINPYAFLNNECLKIVTIPDGVTDIQFGAFMMFKFNIH